MTRSDTVWTSFGFVFIAAVFLLNLNGCDRRYPFSTREVVMLLESCESAGGVGTIEKPGSFFSMPVNAGRPVSIVCEKDSGLLTGAEHGARR